MPSHDLVLLHAPSVYDFRRESILYGPVSDLVPSTPAFEMYPVGFTTIAEYLERHGLRVRIINLAVRMLQDPHFDVQRCLAHLDTAAVGIDLHWLPHAHGAIEVASLLKRLSPHLPIIFGGFSATYFADELIQRPEVDFVMRGDSTEAPMLELVRYLRSGGRAQPRPGAVEHRELMAMPNLVWRDAEQVPHTNPLSYSPDNLDDVLLDYTYVLKAVLRYRDLASFMPFRAWMRYPITAALSVRGCSYNCVTCGGSACAYRRLHGRQRPAFRRPERLAQDIRRIGSFSHGPIFVLGDIRQAGDEYAERFLEAIAGYRKPIFLELFDAPPPGFFRRVGRALSNFTVEISLESHDDRVRRAFGRPYSTAAIERTMNEALDAGCRRLDLFFMVGLKEQTHESIMGTVAYCERTLRRYAAVGDSRVIPFISPLAPFLDPGSRAFEDPQRHGYRLFHRTLEEHRQALLAPSWNLVLNYETKWLDRDAIVAITYAAGRLLNQLKATYGVIDAQTASVTDERIQRAIALNQRIRHIMDVSDLEERRRRLRALKPEVDTANLSTVCDKTELELPVRHTRFNFLQAARVIAHDWVKGRARPGQDDAAPSGYRVRRSEP